MPSRVIMSSANAKTPQKARGRSAACRCDSIRASMSDFRCFETRFM